MILLILLIFLFESSSASNFLFSSSTQRFVYDEISDTIIVASVNRLYSLNGKDLSLNVELNISGTHSEQFCSNSNKTSTSKKHFFFPVSSYLNRSENESFNQILLLVNDSVLTCSTLSRTNACQLRSLIDLNVRQSTSQRLVSSSPFYPSVGFISKNSSILYLSNTYDPICDPFYEIPTISGRHLSENDFLSTIRFNSGQSALQQSSYTLRLLNLRLIKDFFLHYIYAFEYKHFSYFLTIQQADVNQKHRLQTKIVRFCQTTRQGIIKSYVEIPLTCGENYPFLITAKYSTIDQSLYGIFRNNADAKVGSTSHAICRFQMDFIQNAFLQTIKRCLVDGKGSRGLSFLSSDSPCIPSKVSRKT